MEYFLMFHLDEAGYIGIMLKKTFDLQEMDEFITNNFNNKNDAFNYYRSDIEEFCLDKKEHIKAENLRNKHNRTGAITLFAKYKNNYGEYIIKIPIIYGKNKKLLGKRECFKKIKESLFNDNNLKVLMNNKKYLLSKSEMSLINKYFNFNDVSVKKEFIEKFCFRIKQFDDKKQYFFFRSLMNLCKLTKLELKTSKGVIGNINLNLEEKIVLEKSNDFLEIKDEDAYLINLIENNQDEELNKYFDIEKIEKYRRIYKK